VSLNADSIAAKVRGEALSSAHISKLIAGFCAGEVTNASMAEFTRAVMAQGMSRAELRALTRAMVASGTQLDFRHLGKPSVDKHSTGGVGDKITLILAPLVASFGVAVPQLAGRALGHTGGTLDKLEAIVGWKPELTPEQMMAALADHGCCIATANANLAPADAKLYALRDVTGTVASLPLIASSIMSKKIAGGASALVLDVKCGSGAFLPSIEQARELARVLVEIGEDAQIHTRALITDMSTPLGLTVGNSLEVGEALDVLRGGGPADIRELTLALAREMLDLAGLADADAAHHLDDGTALDFFNRMVRFQGGDPDAPLPVARYQHVVTAEASGTLLSLDARAVGEASWHLGAGRIRLGEEVDLTAGVEMHAKPGESIQSGQAVMTLHTSDLSSRGTSRFDAAVAALVESYRVGTGTEYQPRESLILERI
jgi:thymidine phosphorylase